MREKELLRLISGIGNNKFAIVIYAETQLKELYEFFGLFVNRQIQPLIVCLNSCLPLYLEKLKDNLQIKLGDDYLNIEQYENIDDFVYRLTTRWYALEKNGLKDISKYRDIDLGRVVEYDFQRFLIRRIKILEIIESIIQKEQPPALLVISDKAEEFKGIKEAIEKSYAIKFMTFFYGQKRTRQAFSPKKKDFKQFLTEFTCGLIDNIMRVLLLIKPGFNGKVLIDNRIHKDLKMNILSHNDLSPVPFEKGLRLRLEIIKRNFFYFPFYFPSTFKNKRNKFFLSKFNILDDSLDKQGIFNYKGKFIREIIRPKLEEYFKETFPRSARNINLFEKILKKNFLKGVVMRHDLWELQRLSVELCKKFKIHSMVIQHGVFGDKGERVIFADRIAVWGRMCIDMYRAFGNEEGKCAITGNPKHDAFYNNKKPRLKRNMICRQLNLDPGKNIVVFLSDPCNSILSSYTNRDRGEAVIICIIKAMRQLSDKQLIIKLHPYEDPTFSYEAIKYFDIKNAAVVKKFDLYSLLYASDLVITRESSVGVKAMILDKPVITINLEKRGDVIPYASSKAALGVYKYEDLASAIKDVFSNVRLREKLKQGARNFVTDYAYKVDGRSSSRVLDFIEETVR